jgi:hypothetical protein
MSQEVFAEGCLAGAVIGFVAGLLSMTTIVIMRPRRDTTPAHLLATFAGGPLGGTLGGFMAAILFGDFYPDKFVFAALMMLIASMLGSIAAFETVKALSKTPPSTHS